MTNITYYFGAGASAEVLPIVNQIPERIKAQIEELTKHCNDSEMPVLDGFPSTQLKIRKMKNTIEEYIKDLTWLYDNSKRHASIDTFAKKLHIRNSIDDRAYDELQRLKLVFSIFMILEQSRSNADMRYDSFFASILSDSVDKLPGNIKIISWNYDFQFEKAYSEYSNSYLLSKTKRLLNIKERLDTDNISDGFTILKINGTTTFVDNCSREKNKQEILSNVASDLISALERVMPIYKSIKSDITSYIAYGLSFSWENSNSKIIESSREIAKMTDILVVIGYSFPYFNRDVDRSIINEMKNLKKVYFQDKHPDNIKERFLSVCDNIKEVELLSRSYIDQFLLPNEL